MGRAGTPSMWWGRSVRPREQGRDPFWRGDGGSTGGRRDRLDHPRRHLAVGWGGLARPQCGGADRYAPENKGVILFGGATAVPRADGGTDSTTLGDTWLWDGAGWHALNVVGPIGTPPRTRA